MSVQTQGTAPVSAEEKSLPGRFAERAASLRAAIKSAVDTLPPLIAALNATRHFDRTYRYDAIAAWLSEQEKTDDSFAPLEFLEAFCRPPMRDPSAFVALALAYKRAGDRIRAKEAIEHALTLHPSDLHGQKMFLRIKHWAGDSIGDGEDVDDYLKTRYCEKPFEHFESGWKSEVFVCCPSYLPVPIGNLNASTAEEMWNSPVANELRASILDGSFRYCSRIHCGRIAGRKLPPNLERQKSGASIAATTPAVPVRPKSVTLSHDRSCNLACPSCRTDFIVAKKDEQARLQRLLDESIMPILRDARILRVTGSGDPFGSHHFRALLKRINRRDYPHIKVNLHTNGQLFDEKSWQALELRGLVDKTEISIDAARAETYEIVRRGGDFERLKANLTFIRTLRRSGEISSLTLSFVVQAMNFREIPDFVRMAVEFETDRVQFNMIRNWGTYSSEKFKEQFVGDSQHPEHRAFCRVLESPELKHAIVDAGNLLSYATA